MPRCVFCGIHIFSISPGFEKAKINLMRHLDDDDVINGKMMFVGANILKDLPFSP